MVRECVGRVDRGDGAGDRGRGGGLVGGGVGLSLIGVDHIDMLIVVLASVSRSWFGVGWTVCVISSYYTSGVVY